MRLMQCLWMLAALVISRDVYGLDILKGVMPGQVSAAHSKIEGHCLDCHLLGQKRFFDKCVTCHKEVGADARDRNGYHGRVDVSRCETCHSEHLGRDAAIVQLDPKQFDHRLSDFELAGKHRDARCDACHLQPKYRDAPHACDSCHGKEDKHRGILGLDCQSCHVASGWKNSRFDHATKEFKLEGKHQTVDCLACHKTPNLKQTPTECIACHKKDDYHTGALGEACARCHTARAWTTIQFDHARTRFSLDGKHAPVACEGCHTRDNFKATPNTCAACHKKDDAHKGILGSECKSCHAAAGWKPARFDHSTTAFKLEGKHDAIDCLACHKTARLKQTPTPCAQCHKNDDYHQGALGDACASCHMARTWKTVRFDHAATRFRLEGKHAAVRCDGCHTRANFKTTPTACGACHQKDDAHKGILGAECQSCHGAAGWKLVRFDHAKTEFKLDGKHKTVDCLACHSTPRLKETPPACAACHRKVDRHENRLGTDCARCHGPASWKRIEFDHMKTAYPLLGKHVGVACTRCHVAEPYAIKRDCAGCHRKDDRHRGKLGAGCDGCHAETAWKDVQRFSHQRSAFPLNGKHATVACARCHTTPLFKDTSSNCAACHAKDDDHKGRFGTECGSCHTADDWKRAAFDHTAQTRFPLTGAHVTVACENCHVDPLFSVSTSRQCVACHRKDDRHNGELGPRCELCHSSDSFRVIRRTSYQINKNP